MLPKERQRRARLLSIQKASDESGVPVNTLRDLIARGVLASVRLPGVRRVWIDGADLDQLITRSRETAA